MNLIVSSITLVDLSNKEARKIHFSSGKNLLTSDHNHLGKSLIMKSIYYSLGAEVYYPAPITKINFLTYIDFVLGDTMYTVARLKNYFCLYVNRVFEAKFYTVADFEESLSKLFNLEINLVGKDKDQTIIKCPPAFYYMPYYIDQENGWASNSHSFDKLTQFDLPQRKRSYYFHLGALDENYVRANKTYKTNTTKISNLETDNEKYRTVIDTLQSGLNAIDMSFDEQSLEHAIALHKNETQEILQIMTKTRSKLMQEESHLLELEQEKSILSKYVRKCLPFPDETSPRYIECPRCGMIFNNAVANRIKKAYLFESINDDYATLAKNIIDTERRIAKLEQTFATNQMRLQSHEKALTSNKKIYDTYIKSKATSQILNDYYNKIDRNIGAIRLLKEENQSLSPNLRRYTDNIDHVTEQYEYVIRGLLSDLDVPTEQIENHVEPGSALIASGAYGPRCKIAQMLAFVKLQHSIVPHMISFPLVIDSPNVLEQDNEHFAAVMTLIFTWNQTDNQIIVASIQGVEIASKLSDVNIIKLDNPQNHLLCSDEYVRYNDEISRILTNF